MKSKTMFGLVIVGALAFCFAVSQPAVASDEEEVLQVITNYANAFNTLDSDLMTSLLWNSPKTTSFGPNKQEAFLIEGGDVIANSFKTFFSNLKSSGSSYTVSAHNVEITMLGNDIAIVTSYAISTYDSPNENLQIITQDRGTHVLQKIGGKWLIVHTHVSNFPTE